MIKISATAYSAFLAKELAYRPVDNETTVYTSVFQVLSLNIPRANWINFPSILVCFCFGCVRISCKRAD